jgi:hypothetical protein
MNPNGSCRGNDVKNDIAVGGAVAGAVALTVTTAGIGDVVVGGVALGTVGTAAAAASAGAGIAVATTDCRADPSRPQCFIEGTAAVLGTVSGGLDLAGVNLAASGSELAGLGQPMSIVGGAGLGVSALGYTIPTLFGDQLGLTTGLNSCSPTR